jgi:hypothetical protein
VARRAILAIFLASSNVSGDISKLTVIEFAMLFACAVKQVSKELNLAAAL